MGIAYLEFLAGCIGGAAGVVVGHPFDTVKVRLQIQSSEGVKRYRGTFDCLCQTLRQESVFGLYKGLASPIAGIAFINAIIFGVQANSVKLFPDPDSLRAHFIAGGIAGFTQSFVCSPTELSKIRIQMSGRGESHHDYRTKPHKYTGSLDCLHKVFQQEGVRGISKGLNMTLLREVPAFATYFLTYEYLTRRISAWSGKEVNVAGSLLAGGVAGVNSWIVCYPQDVIKSRLQADGVNGPVRYRNAWDCVRQSYKAEGPRMFTEGLSSALLRAFPVNAATFATFSILMKWFKSFDREMVDDVFTSASIVLKSPSVEALDSEELKVKGEV